MRFKIGDKVMLVKYINADTLQPVTDGPEDVMKHIKKRTMFTVTNTSPSARKEAETNSYTIRTESGYTLSNMFECELEYYTYQMQSLMTEGIYELESYCN